MSGKARSRAAFPPFRLFTFPLFPLCLILPLLFFAACSELDKPIPEPYYAETSPPPKQEFRWSNGKMPKSFDPAFASAPPETDIVRAIFEGLTETEAKTLNPVPAGAVKWTASEDQKVWTFELRRNARWSNGDQVTAEDFVRSWRRLAELGEKTSHFGLLDNIVGVAEIRARVKEELLKKEEKKESELLPTATPNPDLPAFLKQNPPPAPTRTPAKEETKPAEPKPKNAPDPPPAEPKPKTEEKQPAEPKEKFGVEAIDKYTLKVELIKPDKDFPALVAHPIFRPIHAEEKALAEDSLNADIITNGAFRISSIGGDGVTLDRAENYWNKDEVQLERVRFVPAENAEKALEAYRAGEIDAVTNADFEPLALKLLTPYDDFRRTVHSALNFYEFNRRKKPFDDRRVRQALTIAIERERLTDDEMDGATKPALSFSPLNEEGEKKIKQDPEKARQLLSEAGFADGQNFPKIKLLINRNNVQQRIARSVARMWKQNLNIETEIIVKEPEEVESIKKSGEYDLVRRGVVLPTSDEAANMMSIFGHEAVHSETVVKSPEKKTEPVREIKSPTAEKNKTESAPVEQTPGEGKLPVPAGTDPTAAGSDPFSGEDGPILTEEDALAELHAIPLYFPTSYSLVQPYVLGFEINTLDAPSLKTVRIDNNWQPKKTGGES